MNIEASSLLSTFLLDLPSSDFIMFLQVLLVVEGSIMYNPYNNPS